MVQLVEDGGEFAAKGQVGVTGQHKEDDVEDLSPFERDLWPPVFAGSTLDGLGAIEES
jgi:hypothetical protein